MIKSWSIACVIACFFALAEIPRAQAQCLPGGAEGIVFDLAGKPVGNAQVGVLSESCAINGIPPSAITDLNGRFIISSVPDGITLFYASKSTAMYPDTRFAINADESQTIPRMRVRAGEITKNVNITMGKMGGLLTGKIVDVVSGDPINSARIIVSIPDDANKMLSRGTEFRKPGTFTMLLASRPLKVEIEAPGYVKWAYTGPDEVSPGVLQIEPGRTLNLTIQLKQRANHQ